jgi:hypothetical protein
MSWQVIKIAGTPSKQKRTVNRHHDTLMVFKSAPPFCFSSPLFNNQPIMSPRDSMCKEKMAKKALTVHN